MSLPTVTALAPIDVAIRPAREPEWMRTSCAEDHSLGSRSPALACRASHPSSRSAPGRLLIGVTAGALRAPPSRMRAPARSASSSDCWSRAGRTLTFPRAVRNRGTPGATGEAPREDDAASGALPRDEVFLL